ncbi:MAG: YadA-like family protein [Phascolarctobacterium sp.]|nr:YadA-like family protein [Phascolarctobacterium sp.]
MFFGKSLKKKALVFSVLMALSASSFGVAKADDPLVGAGYSESFNTLWFDTLGGGSIEISVDDIIAANLDTLGSIFVLKGNTIYTNYRGQAVDYAKQGALAIGATSSATDVSAIAIGNNAVADSNYAIAIGESSVSEGYSSVVIGKGASSEARDSVVIGEGASSEAGNSVVIGNGASSNSFASSGVAIGNGAVNNGYAGVAIGYDAEIEYGNDDSVAIGNKAFVGERALSSVSLGYYTKNYASDSVAIGPDVTVEDDARYSIAIGSRAEIGESADYSLAIGSSAEIGESAEYSLAMGPYANIGDNVYSSVAIGDDSDIEDNAEYSVALGSYATVKEGISKGMALGYDATVSHNNSIALGAESQTYDVHAQENSQKITIANQTYEFSGLASTEHGTVSVGSSGNERQIQNVAAGEISSTSTDAINGSQLFAAYSAINSLADGSTLEDKWVLRGNTVGQVRGKWNSSTKTYDYTDVDYKDQGALAVGPTSSATNVGALAIGENASASGEYSIAIGDGAEATTKSIVMGNNAKDYYQEDGSSWKSYGERSIVIGNDSYSKTMDAIVIGNKAESTAYADTVVIGDRASAGDSGTVAIGAGAVGDGYYGTVVGPNATIEDGNDDSVAVGTNAFVDSSAHQSIAMGRLAQTYATNGIAIGTLAVAGIDDENDGRNAVAIGYRAKSTNDDSVALGSYSETGEVHDTDEAKWMEFDGYVYRFAGQPTASTATVSVGTPGKERQIQNVAAGEISSTSTDAINGSQLYAVLEAVQGLDTDTDTTYTAGDFVTITGDDNKINGANVVAAENSVVTVDYDKESNTFTVDANFIDTDTKYTAGDFVTITGDDNKISGANVVAAENSVITVDYNKDTNTFTIDANITDKDTTYTAGDNVRIDENNVISSASVTSQDNSIVVSYNEDTNTYDLSVAGSDKPEVDAVQAAMEDTTINKNNFDERHTLNINLGTNNESDQFVASVAANTSAAIENIALASEVGDITNEKYEEYFQNARSEGDYTNVVDAVDYTYEEALRHSHVQLTDDEKNLTLDDSQQTEYGGILYTLSMNRDIDIDSATIGGNTYINNEGIKSFNTTINEGGVTTNSVTVDSVVINQDGINAGDKKITNVAAGVNDTDAVNVSQLKELNQNVQNVDNRINKLGSRVNKVGAGAAALAALHPLEFDPDDKWNFAAGYGHYKGENAVAIGAFYRPDEKVMLSIGGTVGNGEDMLNAGVSFSLDRTPRVTNTKTAMARDLLELKALVVELLAERRASRDGLARGMFPDVPENHWAYEYVKGLVDSGILVAYPDGLFNGEHPGTRYEFAAMLFRAMQRGVILPDRVAKEFAPEIGRFRVDRIHGADDNNNKIERIRVNGDHNYGRDNYGSKNPQPVTSRGPQYPESERISK